MSFGQVFGVLFGTAVFSFIMVGAFLKFINWIGEFSYLRITVVYKDQRNKGRPTATVTQGFTRFYEKVETYVCYQTHPVRGATWINQDTGRELNIFHPLYNNLNDAARKAQLEWENKE
jgi:hypothetical protein